MEIDNLIKRFEERNKDIRHPQVYVAKVYVEVLAHSKAQAEETVKIVGEHLNRFDDLKNAKGELV